MKEASGELSMTLITIIAVGVIVAIFAAFWPQIQEAINNRWGRFEEEAGMIVKNVNLD
ncbi:MAG: hypothetical protein IJ501_00225 [Bacilli bacterium]|nr:hypothetical protein [Bacilli bacterium]